MPKLTKKAIRYKRTDGPTDPIYREASLLKSCEILGKQTRQNRL